MLHLHSGANREVIALQANSTGVKKDFHCTFVPELCSSTFCSSLSYAGLFPPTYVKRIMSKLHSCENRKVAALKGYRISVDMVWTSV